MHAHEKEGGVWILEVIDKVGEGKRSFTNWRHNKQMNDSEDMLFVGTSSSLLTGNPFKNSIQMIARAEKALQVEPGDVVEVTDAFGLQKFPVWPPVKRIVCKHTDDICIKGTELGILKKDGTTTRGPYIWLPF